MRALLFNYKCANCSTVTKAPGLPDMSYGEFIMFNNSGHYIYLNAIVDATFTEFRALFKKLRKKYGEIKEDNASNILQATYSIACDSSSDGSKYSITTPPTCKGCGSKKMASWRPTDPPEFIDNVRLPTHEIWNGLSSDEKASKIKDAIEKTLSGEEI